MSNMPTSREKLHISGYVHPSETIPAVKNEYKIFNTESDEKDYVSVKAKPVYAVFSDKQSFNMCPTCGEKALYVCNCELKDKQCANGHVWHINKEGKITKGDPH